MSQDILQQIKASKQGLLNNAFLKLLSAPYLKDWYRKFGGGSFDSFCYFIYRELEQMEQSAPIMQGDLIKQPIDKEYYTPEIYSQLIEERVVIARNMLQVTYEAPLFADKDSIIMHLHLMWHIYEQWSWPPCIKGMCLDLSFAKLLSAANRRIAGDLTKAEREKPRIVNINVAKQKKKAGESEPIANAFWGLKFPKEVFPNGVSLNKIANMIKENLKSKYPVPPSIDTIKRVLRKDEKIWKQFTETKIKGKNSIIMQI